MAPRCRIRSALPPPTHPDGGLGTACDQDAEVLIKLRHPGYPDNKNVLLVFPALDPITADHDDSNNDDNDNNGSNDGTNAKAAFGMHHETARLACAIAANNRWDGFLSRQKGPNATTVLSGPDEVLPAGSYYFHVPPLSNGLSPSPPLSLSSSLLISLLISLLADASPI